MSVINGMIFFNEYQGVFNDPTKRYIFPLGILITIIGVVYLSKRKERLSKIQMSGMEKPLLEEDDKVFF